MKKQVILNKEDIRQCIADAYFVDKNKVDVETFMDIEGYGPNEHEVANVKATVELPMNDQR